jgi:Tfp pilus assembly protein PilX
MTASRIARIRSARRAKSAGGIVFIVAMTISVLAATGMYALRAASMEVRTSGYERQSAQTHYLAEYGVLGATQEVNGTKAQLYLGMMLTQPDSGCQSLAPSFNVSGATMSTLSKACRRMGATELGNTWKNGNAQIPVLNPYGGTPATPGSLGSAPMSGDFFVELTNPTQVAPPAGFDLKLGLCFTQMTVSATGITMPIVNGQTAYWGTSPDTGIYSNEGLETGRARITGGPIRCAQ